MRNYNFKGGHHGFGHPDFEQTDENFEGAAQANYEYGPWGHNPHMNFKAGFGPRAGFRRGPWAGFGPRAAFGPWGRGFGYGFGAPWFGPRMGFGPRAGFGRGPWGQGFGHGPEGEGRGWGGDGSDFKGRRRHHGHHGQSNWNNQASAADLDSQIAELDQLQSRLNSVREKLEQQRSERARQQEGAVKPAQPETSSSTESVNL